MKISRREIYTQKRVSFRAAYSHLEFKVGRNPVISDYYLGYETQTGFKQAGLWGVLTDPHLFGDRAKDIIAPLTMGIALFKMSNGAVPVCLHELLSYCREYPNMKTSVRFLEWVNDVVIDTEDVPWVYDGNSRRWVGDSG